MADEETLGRGPEARRVHARHKKLKAGVKIAFGKDVGGFAGTDPWPELAAWGPGSRPRPPSAPNLGRGRHAGMAGEWRDRARRYRNHRGARRPDREVAVMARGLVIRTARSSRTRWARVTMANSEGGAPPRSRPGRAGMAWREAGRSNVDATLYGTRNICCTAAASWPGHADGCIGVPLARWTLGLTPGANARTRCEIETYPVKIEAATSREGGVTARRAYARHRERRRRLLARAAALFVVRGRAAYATTP